ncbi:hypothetical protein Z959_08815 [Clostridium novyi B str. ATCC 27606]|uniref:Restriction endonuclease type IV Mrr domain-containing protein n=1 Tax=Clostridium novyi B str. ATCC 27606 TaxID=1443123 RepID=A0AA40IUR9_CLONO|nr:hypothetical protein [Clostridium novyi]KEI16919.1 hypothetical protein Z959_08815 [Clostridium novyi B str. ATCC 27606]
MYIEQDEVYKVMDYLDNLADIDPNYALTEYFKHKDEEKQECLKIIDEIENINKLIPTIKDKSQKGKCTLKKGKLLEELALKILNVRRIFDIKPNLKCDSNEIDLLLQPSSNGKLYSRLLPQFMKEDIIVECKNYNKKIDVTWIGKVCSLLVYKKVKYGILFSYNELKGRNEWDASKGLVKKIYLSDNIMIINITIQDIKDILASEKNNIIKSIINKVNDIKYHTEFDKYIKPHPAQQIEA